MKKEPDWKEKLADRIPADLGRDIDTFEQQMELRKQGKIDEKVFAETRLRRGIYGQRYDKVQRPDGPGSPFDRHSVVVFPVIMDSLASRLTFLP